MTHFEAITSREEMNGSIYDSDFNLETRVFVCPNSWEGFHEYSKRLNLSASNEDLDTTMNVFYSYQDFGLYTIFNIGGRQLYKKLP